MKQYTNPHIEEMKKITDVFFKQADEFIKKVKQQEETNNEDWKDQERADEQRSNEAFDSYNCNGFE